MSAPMLQRYATFIATAQRRARFFGATRAAPCLLPNRQRKAARRSWSTITKGERCEGKALVAAPVDAARRLSSSESRRRTRSGAEALADAASRPPEIAQRVDAVGDETA